MGACLPPFKIEISHNGTVSLWTGNVVVTMEAAADALVICCINGEDVLPTHEGLFFNLEVEDKGALKFCGDQFKVVPADEGGYKAFLKGAVERTVTVRVRMFHTLVNSEGQYERKAEIGGEQELMVQVRAGAPVGLVLLRAGTDDSVSQPIEPNVDGSLHGLGYALRCVDHWGHRSLPHGRDWRIRDRQGFEARVDAQGVVSLDTLTVAVTAAEAKRKSSAAATDDAIVVTRVLTLFEREAGGGAQTHLEDDRKFRRRK